ncbi:cupin domain-containing protein [Kribbella turkmenica]|uniref:Cupin domain-containing protein n=1 Tax=Kribbella turkmenica TaxID=2530375 RepID=A0A4R4WM30_9ACTN|nr:cupin domain-containing protein [Kribbella turkmenica]TDD16785.1 cupin domain-containing protein [Kribbella turkmenica]
MQVIRADEAPTFRLPGIEFTGLAAPSRGSAGLCTWKLTVESGAGGGEPHTLDRDEVFMVLSGSVQVTPDGDKLGPGDAAVVPAGEPVRLTNLGAGTAELYVAITAGFTGTMADGTTIRPPWAV